MSKETELLRQEFDTNVEALRSDLEGSQLREKELKTKIQELENLNNHKENNTNEQKLREEVEMLKVKLGEEKSKTDVICNQALREKELVMKQNTELLVKVSGLEARMEEIKRSKSPTDYELKNKITYLQSELDKKVAEFSSKCSEVCCNFYFI